MRECGPAQLNCNGEASVVWSWVCAVITSERAATPAAYWFLGDREAALVARDVSFRSRWSDSCNAAENSLWRAPLGS